MKSYATPLKTAENRADEFYGREFMHPTDWLPISDTKAPQIIKTRLLREGAARPQAETVNGNGF